MYENITFTKDENADCWTSRNPSGTKKTHVRQLKKKPLVITVETEELVKDEDGGFYWVVTMYEAVHVDEIKELYPEASDKVIREHFAKIVKVAMYKGGFLNE